jgi:hypothetical protein
MFKDIEDLVLHGHESKFMAAGRPCSLPSTEVRETSILTPNLSTYMGSYLLSDLGCVPDT